MRLFISINFDETTKQNLVSVQNNLLKTGSGRIVPRDNLHLTLVFIGEVNDDSVASVCNTLKTVEFSRMEIKVGRVGYFPESKELIWAGIEGNRYLNDLQNRICISLEESGFRFVKNRFFPHITLVRNYHSEKVFNSRSVFRKPFSFTADSFSLMSSELDKDGPKYTEIKNFKCI